MTINIQIREMNGMYASGGLSLPLEPKDYARKNLTRKLRPGDVLAVTKKMYSELIENCPEVIMKTDRPANRPLFFDTPEDALASDPVLAKSPAAAAKVIEMREASMASSQKRRAVAKNAEDEKDAKAALEMSGDALDSAFNELDKSEGIAPPKGDNAVVRGSDTVSGESRKTGNRKRRT